MTHSTRFATAIPHALRAAAAMALLLPATACAQGGTGEPDARGAMVGDTTVSGAAAAVNGAMAEMHAPDDVAMHASNGSGMHAHDDMDPSMAAHMRLTPARRASASDSARAREIERRLRDAIAPYRDWHAAVRDGYRPFLPNVPQRVYHFTSARRAMLAAFHFDPSKPTSLLYRKTSAGWELVGAMFTAPYTATLDELDARFPLGIARWHVHTNLCLPRRGEGARLRETRDGHPLFGPRGTITTEAECTSEGGRFFPHLFGWMVHLESRD